MSQSKCYCAACLLTMLCSYYIFVCLKRPELHLKTPHVSVQNPGCTESSLPPPEDGTSHPYNITEQHTAFYFLHFINVHKTCPSSSLTHLLNCERKSGRLQMVLPIYIHSVMIYMFYSIRLISLKCMTYSLTL